MNDYSKYCIAKAIRELVLSMQDEFPGITHSVITEALAQTPFITVEDAREIVRAVNDLETL